MEGNCGTTTSQCINTLIAKVSEESRELQERLSKLVSFMGTGKYLSLRPAHRIMLERQAKVMKEYRDVLDVRYDLLVGDLLQAQNNEESSNQ